MKGKILKSLGEGAYYINLYSKKFEEKLGFVPFPGTLNIEVEPEEVKKLILDIKDDFIEEFYLENKLFGAVHCYKILINTTEGALIIPEKSKHGNNVVEIIAPVHLRKVYNLSDGDILNISKR